MRLRNKIFLPLVCMAVLLGVLMFPVTVLAWGDNSEGGKGRPSYTREEIEKGVLGNQIVFNTISDSVIGDEKNFVGARECKLQPDGRSDGATKDTLWNGNEITVEDGKTYVIRLYVHNNSPNGVNAVSENTRVSFSIPSVIGREVRVNGFIDSSNATPSAYWDYVDFNSEVPFHLEYVPGSALLNNKVTQTEAAAGGYLDKAGWVLSDDIVKAKSGGILIGYDRLDGRIPGCYEYASYITIMVRAVFDEEASIETWVRLADSADKTWRDTVDAKVGDMVDFCIIYRNIGETTQRDVRIKNILPASMRCIDNTAFLRNALHPSDYAVNHDFLMTDGIRIGSYEPGANAGIYFTAKVTDEGLSEGANICVNWVKVEAGDSAVQGQVKLTVQKDINPRGIGKALLTILTMALLLLVIFVGWNAIRGRKGKREQSWKPDSK